MGDTVRETRNRSRSKTPFLRSQCDSESCAHAGEEGHIHHHHEKKKKTPNVQTIIEETVEVTKSPAKEDRSKKVTAKSTVTSISSSITSTSVTKDGGRKTITSDYSSEDASPEIASRQIRLNADNRSSQGAAMQQSSYSSSSTTTTTVINTSGQRMKENKNFKNISTAAMTSTPKAIQQQSFSKVFGDNREISQNTSNSDFERSSQQNRSGNNSSSKNLYTEYSNGSLGEHVAYKEYKDAGEYWNKFPKTDYTYSKRSPHRREILPGVIAMPNMSRRSLENHNDRVTEMIQRDPVQEEYIRRRYAYQCTTNSGNSINRKAAENLIYDSQDEVDLAQFENYRKSNRYLSSTVNTSLRNESWFTRVITSVVTIFSSFWSAISGGKSESDLYKTRITHEQRGVFGRLGHAISSVFLGLFRYVYMAISSVLSLDTWLLKTSNAENRNKKRFLILLLILLPLLLLAGLYYYLNPTEPFPPRSLSEITLTLPSFDLSEFYNQEKYEAFKSSAYNRIDDFKDFTSEYFAYLKTVSMNVLEEGKKLFQENVYYERV